MQRYIVDRRNARELVVDVVAETGSVDDGQRDTHTILLEFCGDSAACRRLYVK